MPANESEGLTPTRSQPLFVTTHWSVVLAAKDKHSPGRTQALETLCRTYWYPLYAYVRRSGHSAPDAQDLTQGFFARFLAKDYLQAVEPEKGRFRSFLKMAMQRFLIREWERSRAEKRGGGQACLRLDTAMAEERFQSERADLLGPDQLYDRRWALTLLDEVTARLEREYTAAGKAAELEQMKPHLTAERGAIPYGELGSTLRTSEGAVRVAMHRLRKRFRELFTEVIAETVSDGEAVEDELRFVISVLGRS